MYDTLERGQYYGKIIFWMKWQIKYDLRLRKQRGTSPRAGQNIGTGSVLMDIALSACGHYKFVLLHLLFVETLQLISTCSNVLKSILMWNMVFWTNQGRRIVNANSYNLCLTATMVLTYQLEVLHGQLTRLSQVKLSPKQSWSSRIYCWCTKQA